MTDTSRDPVASQPAAIPSEILQQITDAAGSRVVLVTGAGVSMEPPTGLKSGAYYSREAHRKLVADAVLDEGDCANPEDLSDLAEAVYAKHSSQRELTSRLPKNAWRTATPNTGHLIAAALLMEGAIHHVISLNYDLAFQNALAELGNSENVTLVEGPDEHTNIGAHSVVYLHRSVNQDEETWVLRKTALDSEWESNWEGAIAAANLTAPLVVFVGLGSPAKVLTDSVERLSKTARSSYYLVDRNLDTLFAQALGANLTGSIGLYWGDFMNGLANRIVAEQMQKLSEATEKLIRDDPNIAPDHTEDITKHVCDIHLLELGRARSMWLLEHHRYATEGDSARQQQVAHLLLGLDRIVTSFDAAMQGVDRHGRITLSLPFGSQLIFGLAHGKGVSSWTAISTKIRARNDGLAPQLRTGIVAVAGVTSRNTNAVDDLIRGDTAGDLIRGADTLHPVFIDDFLSRDPNELRSAIERIA